MADTSIFEVARQSHEEIERYVQAATDLITSTPWTLKKQHQTSKLLDQIVSRNHSLYDFYNDTSGDVKDEVQLLNSKGSDGGAGDGLSEFYERLAKLKDYHKKYPNAKPDVFSVQLDAEMNGNQGDHPTQEGAVDSVAKLFSGEEMGGRYLDLYSHHDAFLNLKGVRRVTYLQYMDLFDKLQGEDSKVPIEAKKSDAYKTYLRGLQSYLLEYLRKTRPLADVDLLEFNALVNFEDDWEAGKVIGWEQKGEELSSTSKIKETPKANGDGIWCDACQRSFAKQTVFDAHLKGQKHIKAAKKLSEGGKEGTPGTSHENGISQGSELEKAKRQAKGKAIARDEAVIIHMGKELLATRAETRANVERRAALTDKERQAEAEAAALELSNGGTTSADQSKSKQNGGAGEGDAEGEDEDDEKIYNPLKLPLGWDGKPIPFWLYKLHGLSVEFKCEICSDYVYQGRKNFERHFSESRHAFGMRALGLPNTKHFYEITRIEDALNLADKLKKQGKIAAEEQEAEEVEDEHGNTYTKKTYELLKRQGLI